MYEHDDPVIELYGPATEGEQPLDAPFLYSARASGFVRPTDEWLTLEHGGGYCGVSPENSREIAGWLVRELEQPWTPPPPRPTRRLEFYGPASGDERLDEAQLLDR